MVVMPLNFRKLDWYALYYYFVDYAKEEYSSRAFIKVAQKRGHLPGMDLVLVFHTHAH